MRHLRAIAVLVLAVTASTCKSSNEPSTSTTTTSVATTTSTTSVVTTSIPVTFTVTGKVTSEKTGELLKLADIEIIQGANIGRRFQGDANGTYTMTNLSAGAFVMRVWAEGYLVKDVQVTLTTQNLTVDVQLTPVPPPTTSVSPLNAAFTFAPNPCTISPGLSVNCTVDSSTSTGNITTRKWNYGGKEVIDQVTLALSFGCGDLVGSGTNRTVSVRLTIMDADGNISTVDNGVPVTIVNNACP
jgi:Carboxypeptidase regulatory-like domain